MRIRRYWRSGMDTVMFFMSGGRHREFLTGPAGFCVRFLLISVRQREVIQRKCWGRNSRGGRWLILLGGQVCLECGDLRLGY
jgi:hypothetical protein